MSLDIGESNSPNVSFPILADVDENATNTSAGMDLPIDMKFNDGHLLSAIVYTILMGISGFGNLSVLKSLVRIRKKARLNRMNLLVMHLVIADLMVTFLMMPTEIAWNITVSWRGGDFMCRLMSFFRTFGLYLSSFIVICISFDRYFAVLRPLALPEANRRGRIMLSVAWIGSAVCSLPQAWVFRLEHHPTFTWYDQCTTLLTFTSKAVELSYNYFGFAFMYGIPMIVIIFCYGSILREVYQVYGSKKRGEDLRRSSSEGLSRAKAGALKMTVIIVTTFFFCWTPYNVMSLWYWIDHDSASKLDQRLQKGLFLFAVSNSCVNPLIYGLFRVRKDKRVAKEEIRLRQIVVVGNKCQLEHINRPPYGLRVRWKPRECLCSATAASASNSEAYTRRGLPSPNTANPGTSMPTGVSYLNGLISPNPYNHHGNQRILHASNTLLLPDTRRNVGNLRPLASRELIKWHLPTAHFTEDGKKETIVCSSAPTPSTSVSIQRNLSSSSSIQPVHISVLALSQRSALHQ